MPYPGLLHPELMLKESIPRLVGKKSRAPKEEEEEEEELEKGV